MTNYILSRVVVFLCGMLVVIGICILLLLQRFNNQVNAHIEDAYLIRTTKLLNRLSICFAITFLLLVIMVLCTTYIGFYELYGFYILP